MLISVLSLLRTTSRNHRITANSNALQCLSCCAQQIVATGITANSPSAFHSLAFCAHLANTEITANSDASVLSLLRTISRNHRNNRHLRCFSVLSLWLQCTLDRFLAFYKKRGMTVNGKTGWVASKSRAVIRHSLAASCSFCSSNTTPNKCLKESTTLLRTPKRARKPNLQIAIMHARLVCSQRSFGIPLKMNGKQRLDLLTLEI